MKKPTFKLQKVLDLRVWREQESAQRLGEAQRRMAEAAEAAEALRRIREAGLEQLRRAHALGGSVGELQNLSYVLGRLEAKIAEADAKRLEAEQRVDATRLEYAKAHQDRRVLERLRDRQLEQARSAIAHAETRVMDDLAVTRHARRAAEEAAEG